VKCEHGPEDDESLGVSLGTPGRGTWVRLWNRADPWDDGSIRACAQIGAPGLLATVHGVTLAVMGGNDLAPFLDGLAGDFSGWDGTRAWTSMDGDLRIDAAFRSRGYVGLTWAITPWRHEDGNWTASATVALEAGEQLRRLAAEIHQFLQPLVAG
jgi:uncharacterized protein DUF6228